MCKKYVNLSLQIWRQKLFVQKVSETAENGYRFVVKKLRLDSNIDSKSLNNTNLNIIEIFFIINCYYSSLYK